MFEYLFEDFPETWDVTYQYDHPIQITHCESHAIIQIEWDDWAVSLYEPEDGEYECLFSFRANGIGRAGVLSKQIARLYDELQ